ncbi:efflux RND transporter permease subunit [Aliiglaciecola sp. LCG003]|uniref:efflux RND transporter permease subunit n=1 Tax=Aliiglaciecola sp. LCG003 TaxID=3053655 RepID=UPI0025744C9E|nr:efflux RND transporter permease subunit [Aliiglaciecola sp. LCG003]WJG09991.1 efflux RND transporter permease subunit [Aliiglaciecola sp. LCG003]
MSQAHHPKVQKGPWFSAFFSNGHLLALTIVIFLVAGLSAISSLPRLEDPRIDTRNVLVLTAYPGASAERVESLVSDVIEDELRQLFEIKEIKSTSRAGISVISVELQPWVDNQTNEQIFSKIRDSLADAKQQFPQGAGEPELDEKRGATSFTLLVGLHSPAGYHTPMSILTRMSEEVADRLRNVSGTELVRTYGELTQEISVEVDPHKLSSVGLNVAQVSQIIASADPKLPAGVVRSDTQNIRIQIAEELASLDVIRNIPLNVSANGQFIHLQDVATVSRGWQQPLTEIALVDGEQMVFVAARMQPTVRVDKWTENAKQALAEFNQLYQGSVAADIVFEQNTYTESRLLDLTQNLLMGSLVVMAVVFLFMGFRSAWIVGISLPLSAAFTIFSLSFFDEQIHQMSIFGIIIAIGLLIDNAIVITDEIRANLLNSANSRMDALVKSVRHLFNPLLASTLTTILGFMPIFLLPGNIGDFIGSIAISVVMALIGSLFISMTVIAALAARYLPRPSALDQKQKWYQGGIQFPILTQWYKAAIAKGIQRPLLILLITVSLPIAGFVLAGQLGNVFFPSADRDQFEIYVWLPDGTAIGKTRAVAEQVDEHIRASDKVAQVTWLVGGSAPSIYYNQVMTRDNTAHFAHAVVKTVSVRAAAGLIAQLQNELDDSFPQAKVVVRAFGQGPPISAPIGVEIYGPDLAVIDELGQQVRLAMSQLPGITNSIASITMGEPELILNVTRTVSSLSGLSLNDIASQLRASLDGQIGGSVLEGTEEIPIRVRVPASFRNNLDSLNAMPLLTPALINQQSWLPVSALGEFELRSSIAGITRKNGERVNIVEGFLLPNATAVDVSNGLSRKLSESGFDLPKGYKIKMAGDADEQQEALGLLATYAPVLLVLMITTLILTFRSVKLAMLIASVAVLSVGLGMFSLWLSGLPIGFNPLLGCAGLIGVAINGSIVVIASINANSEARMGDLEQIVRETMSCSRHILSTTFTTVGGFIPLLIFSEGTFWPPLAVVLAGGVGFSVILSLVFTPIVAGRLAIHRGKQAMHASPVMG